jgi:hypothetical protein
MNQIRINYTQKPHLVGEKLPYLIFNGLMKQN